MKFTRFFVSGALSIALAAAAASAQSNVTQTPAPTQAEQEAARAARAELEAKAFKLLEEAAAEAESLRLPENRVRLQAVAAAALWPHDQESAREIFQSALTGISAIASSLPAEDPRFEQHYHHVQNLRREIAFAVAQRDPKLALDFVRGTRVAPPPRPGDGNYYQPDQELALEMQLAELVAARDPREAIRIAEESLARGVSGTLPSVIERIHQHDPQAASRFAAEVVRKLRTTNLATNFEAASVAAYLLRATQPAEAAALRRQSSSEVPTLVVTENVALTSPPTRGLTLDETARRDLIAAMVNAALVATDERRGRGRGNQLLSALQGVLPEVERLMPAQAPALRRRLAETGGTNNQPAPRARSQEYEQLMQTGTADAILQAAARAPAEMRWQLYRRAASKAIEEGSPERARQIINDSVTDPRQREQLLREIDQQLFWRTAGQGDAQQALSLLARFKSPEERTHMLLSLAQSAAARGNRELAERLLEEVLGLTGGRAKNMAQFSLHLQAGHAYANFAPERAFQIAESSVERLNELLGVAEQVDGFGQEAFDQGELKLEGSVWSGLVQQTGGLLAALAPKDFARAREVAVRFQRGEARAHAMLAVARGILGGGEAVRVRGGRRPQTAAPLVRRP